MFDIANMLVVGERPEGSSATEAVYTDTPYYDYRGRLVVYRSVIIPGDQPEGQTPFRLEAKTIFKVPDGREIEIPFRTSMPGVTTLAEAFAAWDKFYEKGAEAAQESAMKQLTRAQLLAGTKK